MGCFCHCVGFQDWRIEGRLEFGKGFWGERGGAGANKANGGKRRGGRVTKEYLVDGGDGSVLSMLVKFLFSEGGMYEPNWLCVL